MPDGIDTPVDTDFEAVFYQGYNQEHPNEVDNVGVPSAYGTVGQGGNVWEWNETTIGSSRGIRGGDWWDDISYSIHARARDLRDLLIEYDDSIGFRVAQVPEPGTITLLLCGLLSLALLRRRR